jgi:deoxyribose-phosphate aldolase
VRVVSVAGFPHGNTVTAAKVAETRAALADGAAEIDMVMAIGALKDGDREAVSRDIAAVAGEVHAAGGLLKVIVEASLLSDGELVLACTAAEAAGADFVKTSTGFGPGGATADAVRRMRATVSARVGVKAAGGIRDYAAARAMVEAGANRIGASASAAILRDAPE